MVLCFAYWRLTCFVPDVLDFYQSRAITGYLLTISHFNAGFLGTDLVYLCIPAGLLLVPVTFTLLSCWTSLT